MADTLAVLARIRRLQADLAKRDLAAALHAEAQAQAALLDAQQAPLREAACVHDADLAMAFARWLPASAVTAGRCAATVQRAEAACAGAAAALQARKGALEAVEAIQQDRQASARLAALRRLQITLDEVAGRRKVQRR